MRNLLIAVVLGITGLTFYSAFAYKSKIIEDDITKRVTDELTTSNAKGVGIDVDGRHVTLSGIVYDEAQEKSYLDTANDTYGALGPIDGLTYQGDGGYVTAQKTADGIALRGSVPNEEARASLLEAAAAATDGAVDDQLTVSGPEADWQGETQFGMQQLAALSTGAMTASAAGFVLSGTTDGDVSAVTAPIAERDGWSAFVSSPVAQTGLQSQINDLNGSLSDKDGEIAALMSANADLTGERDALNERLNSLKDGMSDELVNGESLRAELNEANANFDAASADLEAANATIADRDRTIAEFSTDKTTLISRTLEADNKLAESQQKLTGATATIAALTATVASKESEAGTLNGRISDLETELENRQQALGSTDEQVTALQGQVSKLDSEVYTLEATVAARDTTIDNLNARLTDTSSNLENDNARMKALETMVDDRDITINELTLKNADLSGENAAAGAKVTTLTDEVGDLKAVVAARDGALEEANGQIEVLSVASAAKDENINTLTGEIGEWEEVVAQRDASIAVLGTQIAGLNDAAATKDADIETLNGKVGDLEAVVADRDRTLAETGTQIAALNTDVATKDADIGTLTGKVDELTTVVAARDATIAALRARPTNSSSGNVAETCAAQASSVMEGSRINFGSGNARITNESNALLERLTGIALACVGSDLTVEIGGHTDSQGSTSDNQALSERRAQAVLAFMAERGVSAEGVRAVGFGETSPIADNATAAGRAANRRITFEWQAR
jgi:outer membrane protein OmpA-like peptidoglycan-associated protein/cell division protein FtsL